jgi:hypothetical protein
MSSMADSSNTYSTALFAAWEELTKLNEEERAIAVRKSQLRHSADALYPLVFPDAVEIKNLSLPDAMRLVLRSSGRGLNAHDFRTKLEDIGFNLEQYSDPMASILTAMKRMADAEEMHWVPDAPRKTVTAAPEMKPVPELPSSLPIPEGLETAAPSFSEILGQGIVTPDEGGSK